MQQAIHERPGTRRGGRPAMIGAVLAVVGVLAAANPQNAVLHALGVVAPQLADVVPTVITSCGAILAAFSAPPRLRAPRAETPSGGGT